MKVKACEEIGIVSRKITPPADIRQEDLESLIRELNADADVDGILVQLPLPIGLESQSILDLIDPCKDVDGFHPVNVGLLSAGLPCFKPCTPAGCIELLKRYNLPTKGIV